MINDLLGNRQQGNAAQTGAHGFSLDQLLTGPGGLATGAAAGGLAGLLLGGGKPKKLAKNAVKLGGAALVGGLAYKAWRDWQANKTPAAPAGHDAITAPVGTPFLPDAENEQRSLARALMRAMVTAAKADGHVTPQEQGRIVDQLDKLGMGPAERSIIRQELAAPMDIEAVVRDAKTPELAAELYTASLLAVDPTGAAERGYLALLASRLGLEPALVDHIHVNAAVTDERDAA